MPDTPIHLLQLWPRQHARLQLEEINDRVRPTAIHVRNRAVPAQYRDHFPIDADDLIQVAWVRTFEREDRDKSFGEDGRRNRDKMVQWLNGYIRNIGREYAKLRGVRAKVWGKPPPEDEGDAADAS